jgi:diguanylate cyclase (GGDEF)-like protein
VALILSSFSSLFRHHEHFYEIRSEQTRWAILCLLLLFNGWLVYRQRLFRRAKRQFTVDRTDQLEPQEASGSVVLDLATGLYTRSFVELQLGREIARAKRENTALTLATIHIEEFDQLNARHGPSAMDMALKELARRLRKSCRGSDFAARLSNDDFLLVLPECGLNEVKLVLNRLGSLEMNCAGHKVTLDYTTGWVDYRPGDMPATLLKRAAEILHLYENAAKATISTASVPS